MAYNLTVQLQLQSPKNIGSVVNDIKRQLGSIDANIRINVKDQAQLKNLSQTLKSVRSEAEKTSKAIETTTSVVRNFGYQSGLAAKRFAAFTLPAGSFYALASAVKAGTSAFLDFQNQTVRLEQITGKTGKEITGITDEVIRLSKSLGVSSQTLSEAAETLAQAGLGATKTKVALEALAKTQLAPTFRDIENTTEGVISILNQFKSVAGEVGIEVEDLERVLGSINRVSADFAVESEDIVTVIRKAGSTFRAASGDIGSPIEQLNQLIALFTSVRQTTRLSADTISQGFNTIFARIQRPQTISFLEKFGIKLTTLEGKFVGPFEAIRRLNSAIQDLDTNDLRFAQIGEELGGVRQLKNLIPLLQQFGVAQKAYNVAQAGGNSLTIDAARAQKSLLVQLTKVREEFFDLIRTVGNDKNIQAFISVTLDLSKALIQLTKSITPLIPALTTFAGIKIAKNIFPFVRGFATGLSPQYYKNGTQRFAGGGLVGGVGNTDSVNADMMPGEFVIRKKAVQTIGRQNLDYINRKGRMPRANGSRKREEYNLNPSNSIIYWNDGSLKFFQTKEPQGYYIQDIRSGIPRNIFSTKIRGQAFARFQKYREGKKYAGGGKSLGFLDSIKGLFGGKKPPVVKAGKRKYDPNQTVDSVKRAEYVIDSFLKYAGVDRNMFPFFNKVDLLDEASIAKGKELGFIPGGVARSKSRTIGINPGITTNSVLIHELTHLLDTYIGKGKYSSEIGSSGIINKIVDNERKRLLPRKTESISKYGKDYTKYRLAPEELLAYGVQRKGVKNQAKFFKNVTQEYRAANRPKNDITPGIGIGLANLYNPIRRNLGSDAREKLRLLSPQDQIKELLKLSPTDRIALVLQLTGKEAKAISRYGYGQKQFNRKLGSKSDAKESRKNLLENLNDIVIGPRSYEGVENISFLAGLETAKQVRKPTKGRPRKIYETPTGQPTFFPGFKGPEIGQASFTQPTTVSNIFPLPQGTRETDYYKEIQEKVFEKQLRQYKGLNKDASKDFFGNEVNKINDTTRLNSAARVAETSLRDVSIPENLRRLEKSRIISKLTGISDIPEDILSNKQRTIKTGFFPAAYELIRSYIGRAFKNTRKLFAKGGPTGKDKIPALLTPGEYVINAQSAAILGNSRLNDLNHADKIQRFNKGGPVRRFAGGSRSRNPGLYPLSLGDITGTGDIPSISQAKVIYDKIAKDLAKLSEYNGEILNETKREILTRKLTGDVLRGNEKLLTNLNGRIVTTVSLQEEINKQQKREANIAKKRTENLQRGQARLQNYGGANDLTNLGTGGIFGAGLSAQRSDSNAINSGIRSQVVRNLQARGVANPDQLRVEKTVRKIQTNLDQYGGVATNKAGDIVGVKKLDDEFKKIRQKRNQTEQAALKRDVEEFNIREAVTKKYEELLSIQGRSVSDAVKRFNIEKHVQNILFNEDKAIQNRLGITVSSIKLEQDIKNALSERAKKEKETLAFAEKQTQYKSNIASTASNIAQTRQLQNKTISQKDANNLAKRVVDAGNSGQIAEYLNQAKVRRGASAVGSTSVEESRLKGTPDKEFNFKIARDLLLGDAGKDSTVFKSFKQQLINKIALEIKSREEGISDSQALSRAQEEFTQVLRGQAKIIVSEGKAIGTTAGYNLPQNKKTSLRERFFGGVSDYFRGNVEFDQATGKRVRRGGILDFKSERGEARRSGLLGAVGFAGAVLPGYLDQRTQAGVAASGIGAGVSTGAAIGAGFGGPVGLAVGALGGSIVGFVSVLQNIEQLNIDKALEKLTKEANLASENLAKFANDTTPTGIKEFEKFTNTTRDAAAAAFKLAEQQSQADVGGAFSINGILRGVGYGDYNKQLEEARKKNRGALVESQFVGAGSLQLEKLVQEAISSNLNLDLKNFDIQDFATKNVKNAANRLDTIRLGFGENAGTQFASANAQVISARVQKKLEQAFEIITNRISQTIEQFNKLASATEQLTTSFIDNSSTLSSRTGVAFGESTRSSVIPTSSRGLESFDSGVFNTAVTNTLGIFGKTGNDFAEEVKTANLAIQQLPKILEGSAKNSFTFESTLLESIKNAGIGGKIGTSITAALEKQFSGSKGAEKLLEEVNVNSGDVARNFLGQAQELIDVTKRIAAAFDSASQQYIESIDQANNRQRQVNAEIEKTFNIQKSIAESQIQFSKLTDDQKTSARIGLERSSFASGVGRLTGGLTNPGAIRGSLNSLVRQQGFLGFQQQAAADRNDFGAFADFSKRIQSVNTQIQDTIQGLRQLAEGSNENAIIQEKIAKLTAENEEKIKASNENRAGIGREFFGSDREGRQQILKESRAAIQAINNGLDKLNIEQQNLAVRGLERVGNVQNVYGTGLTGNETLNTLIRQSYGGRGEQVFGPRAINPTDEVKNLQSQLLENLNRQAEANSTLTDFLQSQNDSFLKNLDTSFQSQFSNLDNFANRFVDADGQANQKFAQAVDVFNNAVQQFAAGGGAVKAATGGLIYANKGYFKPKGTDTVPAMLTPGEFVVNAKSAKANEGLLRGINSAKGPIYRAGGGKISATSRLYGKDLSGYDNAFRELLSQVQDNPSDPRIASLANNFIANINRNPDLANYYSGEIDLIQGYLKKNEPSKSVGSTNIQQAAPRKVEEPSEVYYTGDPGLPDSFKQSKGGFNDNKYQKTVLTSKGFSGAASDYILNARAGTTSSNRAQRNQNIANRRSSAETRFYEKRDIAANNFQSGRLANRANALRRQGFTDEQIAADLDKRGAGGKIGVTGAQFLAGQTAQGQRNRAIQDAANNNPGNPSIAGTNLSRTQARQNFQKNGGTEGAIIQSFKSITDNLAKAAETLDGIKFDVTTNGKVEVIINGAQALSELEPTFKKLIETQIDSKIKELVQKMAPGEGSTLK